MWSKPDALDRLAQALVAIAGVVSLANGLFMLADPFGWYAFVGTVKATGPANGHFIRDIGLAYLLSAVLLNYAAFNLPMRWAAALAGTGWLLMHGLLHIWEVGTGLCAPDVFWRDAPGVLGPPLLALAGIGTQFARRRIASGPLPGALFFPAADRMTFGLSPHLPDLRRGPGHLGEKFRYFMDFALHRHEATIEQAAFASLGAVQAEDCGPCVEIAARGALMRGIDRNAINAALRGEQLSGAAGQALAFGRALASGDPAVVELGEAIEAQFGRAVRAELTVTAAATRVHPALKRGLGFGQACAARPLQF